MTGTPGGAHDVIFARSAVVGRQSSGVASLRTKLRASFRALRKRERLMYSLIAVSALTVGLAIAGIESGLFRNEIYKDTAILSIQAPVRVLAMGDTIEVSVHLNSGGESVGGVTAEIAYDPEVLEPVDSVPGGDFNVKSVVFKPDEVKATLDSARIDPRTKTAKPAIRVSAGNFSLANADAMDADVFAVSFKALRDTSQTKLELLFEKGSTEYSHVTQYTAGNDTSTDFYELLLDVQDLQLQVTPRTNEPATPSSTPEPSSVPQEPEPTVPPPVTGSEGLTASLRASPDTVTGTRSVTFALTISSGKELSNVTITSANAVNGILEHNKATLAYEDGTERATPPTITLSGSIARSGLVLATVPAGTTTIEFRGNADGDNLKPGRRTSIVDTIFVGDASTSYKVVIRSAENAPEPSRTPEPTPTPAPLPSSAPAPAPIPTPTPVPSTPPASGGSTGGSTTTQNAPIAPAPPTDDTRVGGSIPASATDGPFLDVPASHPAASAISILKARGALEGYDPNHFGPEALLTRAEMAKILVLAKGVGLAPAPAPIPDADPANFPGDPNFQAFYPTISTAVAQGWMQLVNGIFQPWEQADRATIESALSVATGSNGGISDNGPITRADYCVAVVAAMGL